MIYDIVISKEPVEYLDAVEKMNKRKIDILNGKKKPLFWILEHKDVYTAGRMFHKNDILNKSINVIRSDRGGRVTYHGQGQLVGYIITNLKEFNNGVIDVKKFVSSIENLIILTLQSFGIEAFTLDDDIGIWVIDNEVRKKIASIGISVRNMITMHGFALNVSTNLRKFESIVPCGNDSEEYCSVLSLLNKDIDMTDIQNEIIKMFKKNF